MTERQPRLTGEQLIKILSSHGFTITRVRGSHHVLKHPDGRMTVVPVHKGELIGPGLLKKILRDTDLEYSDLK